MNTNLLRTSLPAQDLREENMDEAHDVLSKLERELENR